MKGFYIEISNELLDPKHCATMGDSVWLFMWLIDKMTLIDHDKGEGKVLGGKPIKYEEVNIDIGISRSTYMRWMARLKKGEYIKTLRTPQGVVITVMKAKKRFGRSTKNDTSQTERCSKNDTSDVSKATHQMSDSDTSNKTVSVDTTDDTTKREAEPLTPKQRSIKFFDDVLKLVKGEQVPELQDLLRHLHERNGVPKQIFWDEIREFCAYWNEKNQTGMRKRWEMEKTFEIDRRLTTWFRKAKFKNFNANFNNKPKGKTVSV